MMGSRGGHKKRREALKGFVQVREINIDELVKRFIDLNSKAKNDNKFVDVSLKVGDKLLMSKYNNVSDDLNFLTLVVLNRGTNKVKIKNYSDKAFKDYFKSLLRKYRISGKDERPDAITLSRIPAMSGPISYWMAAKNLSTPTGDMSEIKKIDEFPGLNHNNVAVMWPQSLERYYPYMAAYEMDKVVRPERDSRKDWAKKFVDTVIDNTFWDNEVRRKTMIAIGVLANEDGIQFSEEFKEVNEKAKKEWGRIEENEEKTHQVTFLVHEMLTLLDSN